MCVSPKLIFSMLVGKEAGGQEGGVGSKAFNNAPIAKPVVIPAAATEYDSLRPQLQNEAQGRRFSPN